MTNPKPLVHPHVQDAIHIIPTADGIPHSMTRGCPCSPDLHQDGFYIHHSFDGYPDFEPSEQNIQAAIAADLSVPPYPSFN